MDEHARILVVDDDESIRKILSTILEDEGYSVDTAQNGKEALERSNREFYNLALIDVRLPDIEGVVLLAKFRETTPPMRKIIITGFPSIQNAIEAVNNKADGYILKPFDISKILEMIKEQLKKQQQEKQYDQKKVAEFIEARVRESDIEQITQPLHTN